MVPEFSNVQSRRASWMLAARTKRTLNLAEPLFDGARAQRYRTSLEQDSYSESDEERDRLEKALEEGLHGTFPASDAVSVVQPAPLEPHR